MDDADCLRRGGAKYPRTSGLEILVTDSLYVEYVTT